MSVKNKQNSQTRLKNKFSLRGALWKTTIKKAQTDDSDIEIDAHRPRCPWARRQSYIRKINNIQYMASPSYGLESRQSVGARKKPWQINGIRTKEEPAWNRPIGNRHPGVNCFCLKMEQARNTAIKKHLPHEWMKTRRSNIVGKFDGFSKGVLKVTGKLSEETISMITEKIRDNLIKANEERTGNKKECSAVIISTSTSNTTCDFSTKNNQSCDKENSSELHSPQSDVSTDKSTNENLKENSKKNKLSSRANMIKSSINVICKLRPLFRSSGDLTGVPSKNKMLISTKKKTEKQDNYENCCGQGYIVELVSLKPR